MNGIVDDIDVRIVDLLQRNGRTPQSDIARAVGLAPSAVLERVRKLEAKGIVRGYAALLDPESVDLGLLAFIAVRTEGIQGDEEAGRLLAEIPEVLEVHHVAGDDCFLLKVRVRNTSALGDLLKARLSHITGITSTRTTIVLGTLKETPRLPLTRAAEDRTGPEVVTNGRREHEHA